MPRLSQAQLRAALRQPSEKALQRDVVGFLRDDLRYTVMETGRPTKAARCPHCRAYFHPDTGTANTPGCPDLYVAHSASGNVWRAIELKAPGAVSLLGRLAEGTIRPDQQALVDLGVSTIATSVSEALQLVEGLRR